MATLEELQEKLQADDWSKRRDAARALGKMKDQRDMVVPLLKEQLRVDDDEDVIEALVEALQQLGGLDDEAFQILKGRISDRSRDVRQEVVRGLAKFGHRAQEVVPLLKERLKVDNSERVIEVSVEALHDFGVTIEQMSRILAQNPHSPFEIEHHFRGVARQVVEHTLRQRWWRLPVEVRRHLSPPWGRQHWWHHCPECYEMWHELRYLLEGRRGGRSEADWLLATMGRWWGDLCWRFGCHDFEGLMSLRVEQNVTYEEVNTLRFRFLDAFVTDRQERPIAQWARRWLGEFQQDWDELLRTEEQFDQVRDEISDLRRQQDEIIREAERRTEGQWRWEPGEPLRLPEDLQGRWNEISEQLRRLEGYEEPGRLQTLRRPLEEATERLLPQLRKLGVSFKVIEVEGVLGEYNFYERKVTLYPPMIALAAGDLALALKRSPGEVYDDLYTVTEMHETAHAVTHLGIDSDGRLWEHPNEGTSELHELLAQFYTLQLIRRIGQNRLERVFLVLNDRQPERYRYWKALEGMPLEIAREFLRQCRDRQAVRERWGSIMDLATSALEIIHVAMPLLQHILPKTELHGFLNGLKSSIAHIEMANTRWELANALDILLKTLEAHPFALSILQRALLFGWPTAQDRKILLAQFLTEGAPIQAPSLRLTLDQILAARTAALMQNELVRRNTIVHQLRAIGELPIPMEPEKIAEDILSQLPKEREKSP